jgi:hypothetical protein
MESVHHIVGAGSTNNRQANWLRVNKQFKPFKPSKSSKRLERFERLLNVGSLPESGEV